MIVNHALAVAVEVQAKAVLVHTDATIDGAFVIRGDGVIMSAGVFLKSAKPAESLPAGLGARHTAAAAITATTAAVSVVISQSTGMVSVFRKGRRILALEKSKK